MFCKQSHLSLLAVLLIAIAGQAQATLILDTSVTSTFSPAATTTGTPGNDLPQPRPDTLYFGQLGASDNGFVDFYYVGNEAAYTNTMVFGNGTSYSTASLPDNFNSPHPLIASMAVSAGSLLEFGFCTSGGDSVGAFGGCVYNNDAASITAQYNYQNSGGYRSIGYAGLSSYDPTNGSRTFSNPLNPGNSLSWMVFWDDSGARNDDDSDDMIAVATFRPAPTTRVTEPGTLGLVGLGLMALALTRRRLLAATARR
jgi:hypothetical protein